MSEMEAGQGRAGQIRQLVKMQCLIWKLCHCCMERTALYEVDTVLLVISCMPCDRLCIMCRVRIKVQDLPEDEEQDMWLDVTDAKEQVRQLLSRTVQNMCQV